MRELNNQMFKEFRRLDGARFLAYLTTTAQAPTKDVMPYRTLVVKSRGIAAPGMVIVAPDGRKLLLMETPNDHPWTESFRAAYVSREYPWKRRTVTTDSVSLVKRDTGFQDLGLIYAYFDKPQVIMLEKEQETKYRFFTGQDVIAGDVINEKTVRRVYDSMGVKAVEIE